MIEDGITFAWSTANDVCFGYAGIELALLGVPTYFYNLVTTNSAESIYRATDGAVHSYSSEAELAEATSAAWQCPDRMDDDAHRLRAFVQKHNDSNHVVRQIEAFYARIIDGHARAGL